MNATMTATVTIGMRDTTTTGDRIRSARQARKLTQTQLGQLLQPPQTRQAVYDLETGRYEPSANTLRGLCAALGVSCDWLLGIAA